MFGRHVFRRPTAGAVALALLAVGTASQAGAAPATAPTGTLVFASDRSGVFQIYSIRADGSQLGQLTRGKAADTAPVFSPDGSRIVFSRTPLRARSGGSVSQLWVMNADGSGQHMLAAAASTPEWSPDSRRIAYLAAATIAVKEVGALHAVFIRGRNDINPRWSPDGKLIAFGRRAGETACCDRYNLMVVRPDGSGLRKVRSDAVPLGWSPQGEIAFTGRYHGVALIGADGRGARRLLRIAPAELVWSPDGQRLAYVGGDLPNNGLHVASANGSGLRDLPPQSVNSVYAPVWSPDGRWLAISYAPNGTTQRELLLVAADGSSTRRLTTRVPRPWGTDYGQLSWRPRGATPARLGGPPAASLPMESVSATSFTTVGTIHELAADGGLAAVSVANVPPSACAGVETWEPARRRSVRLHLDPCSDAGRPDPPHDGLAVAGRRVAWFGQGGGNTIETTISMATPEQPSEVLVAHEGSLENGVGTTASRPVGRGGLLAFAVTHRCGVGVGGEDECPAGRSEGDVTDTTLWRLAGTGRKAVVRAHSQLFLLAADAHRIVVETDDRVRLISAGGKSIRTFSATAADAALSGKRLALQTPDGLRVYDTASGRLVRRLPAANANLADLEADVLVTTSAATVTVRSLAGGRTIRFHTDGTAKAKITRVGLFLAGDHRVTFMPLREVVRRLRR